MIEEIPKIDDPVTLKDIERNAVLDALEDCKGDVIKAAELLDCSYSKIYGLLREWREE